MSYERQKLFPWESLIAGEWHEVRVGPAGEDRAESLRIFARYKESARSWAYRNKVNAQVSRQENGRIIRVRITSQDPSGYLPKLQAMSRFQLGQNLREALRLLDYIMVLRMYGERAPGGNETWRQFDANAEEFLRSIKGLS